MYDSTVTEAVSLTLLKLAVKVTFAVRPTILIVATPLELVIPVYSEIEKI